MGNSAAAVSMVKVSTECTRKQICPVVRTAFSYKIRGSICIVHSLCESAAGKELFELSTFKKIDS